MDSVRQLRLLIHKNFLLRAKHKCVAFLQFVLVPFVLAILFWIVRRSLSSTAKSHKIWDKFDAAAVPLKLDSLVGSSMKVAFVPNSTLANTIAQEILNETSPYISALVAFPNETELEKEILRKEGVFLAGIVFNSLVGSSSSSLPSTFFYTLRFPSRKTVLGGSGWKTHQKYVLKLTSEPFGEKDEPNYSKAGFLFLQSAVDRVVLVRSGAKAPVGVSLERMPYPNHKKDAFMENTFKSAIIILGVVFLFVEIDLVRSIVKEKESRLKQFMKMMGLRDCIRWAAWYINYWLMTTISCFIILCVFMLPTANGPILAFSNRFLVFLFMIIHVHSVILFSFAASTFFKHSRTASEFEPLIEMVPLVIFMIVCGKMGVMSIPFLLRIVMCLLPLIGFLIGWDAIRASELQNIGLQWYNIASGVYPQDSLSMLHIWSMLILSSILCVIFLWYVENTLPGEFGIPLPWLFPFTRHYWCGRDVQEVEGGAASNASNPNMEPDPSGLRCKIELSDLTKKYDKSDRPAVDHLNLRIFQDQITALLGHNGAGKTSTMHMITGFIPPTSGSVFVNGVSVAKDPVTVRQQLGLCPQHNVFFEEMTVEQHLRFFAKLKKCAPSKMQSEIKRMITSTGLQGKRHALPGTLSGGQQRKLNVAIALIGFSKVVVLDEPSSGADPNARRDLWSFLQAERDGRATLLSTHFMDEADALGDRIAIVAFGELQCVGTPLFLKSRFGTGYHLTMVKSENCDVQAVMEAVTSRVPGAHLESDDGDELSFVLPTDASSSFEALFSRLETESAQLGIASFGASITSMEEVFLRVSAGAEKRQHIAEDVETRKELVGAMRDRGKNKKKREKELFPASDNFTGVALFFHQFCALFKKSCVVALKRLFQLLIWMLIPAALVLYALLRDIGAVGKSENDPPLNLTLQNYGALTMVFGRPRADTSVEAGTFLSGFQAVFKSRPETTFNNFTDRITKNESEIIDFLLEKAEENIKTFKKRYIVGAYASDGNSHLVFYNGEALHAVSIALNAATNALLHSLGGDVRSVVTANHPLPMKFDVQREKKSNQYVEVNSLTASGFSFFTALVAYMVVLERVTKVKLMYSIAGANNFVYWVATLAFDFFHCLIVIAITATIVFLLGDKAYNATAGRFIIFFLILVFYVWAILPFIYLLSHLFKTPGTSVTVLMLFTTFAGLFDVIIKMILSMIPSLPEFVSKVIDGILYLIPGIRLQECLKIFTNNYVLQTSCEKCKTCCKAGSWTDNYLSYEKGGIGKELTSLAVEGASYLLLCILLHSETFYYIRVRFAKLKFGKHRVLPSDEDSDVAAQREKAEKPTAPSENMLVIRKCSRFYGRNHAVRNISCAIPEGECFGLLGVNGAGKTTTFKMLTGDLPMSSGDIFINGSSVAERRHTAQRQLGYCPQFGGVLEKLTGREFLTLFSCLRGRSAACVKKEVQLMIEKFLLSRYADNRIETYSGGNQRKLSAATAMIGSPPVVCLDEPTTGMDPLARRYFWQILKEYRMRGNTLVLTSHSMEECEALCTKIAIMVNGQFQCFGSCQQLKDKFGKGLSLQAKLPFNTSEGGNAYVENFVTFVNENFPSSRLTDQHQGLLHYHLDPDSKTTWSKVFGIMENNKKQLNLENYSVSQTSLDEIFIQFARNQNAEEKDTRTSSKMNWQAAVDCPYWKPLS